MKQKTKETVSTLRQALDWWNNLPVWGVPSKEYYMGLYYSDDTVTPEKIEQIWLKETQSTRQQAAQWFANKSFLEQFELSDKYFDSKNPSLFTIEQVEEIWLEEMQHQSEEKTIEQHSDKSNKKQYSQEEVDYLLDQQAAITTAQILKSNQKQPPVICLNCKEIYNKPIKQCSCGGKSFQNTHPSNAKQFKEFNPDLFRAYIDKFSDEDKEKCFEILMKNLDIQKAELINDGVNLNLMFLKF